MIRNRARKGDERETRTSRSTTGQRKLPHHERAEEDYDPTESNEKEYGLKGERGSVSGRSFDRR